MPAYNAAAAGPEAGPHAKIRLHLDQPLGPGQALRLDAAQAHYLFAVMRLGPGARLRVFDGRSGEWLSEVAEAGRRGGTLTCLAPSAPQRDPPDLWFLFAPIKKARTDFIVEKATELGAARILPVQTDYTNAERIRPDRLRAHAVEAAEQCGGTYVPEVSELRPLSALLDGWDSGRRILWADEGLAAPAPRAGDRAGAAADAEGPGGVRTLAGLPRGPWAILIGPEGGFSPRERARLGALGCVTPLRLGPRILRADTAACAALSLWQATLGDWR